MEIIGFININIMDTEKAIEYAQKLYPLDKKAAEYVAFMKGFKYGRENGKKKK